ncbi:MAG TPA: AtpZ/AtpI family protein [Bacteroidota bacterium]|nr:AtpZ/AtpI family protein [Bacteroidota bacterium]
MTIDSGTPEKKEKPANIFRDVAPFLSLGFQLASVVVVFFFLGHWIDNKFSISPIGKLTGLVLGMVGGFLQFFRTVAALTNDTKSIKGSDQH